jgi:hypothetical protein
LPSPASNQAKKGLIGSIAGKPKEINYKAPLQEQEMDSIIGFGIGRIKKPADL